MCMPAAYICICQNFSNMTLCSIRLCTIGLHFITMQCCTWVRSLLDPVSVRPSVSHVHAFYPDCWTSHFFLGPIASSFYFLAPGNGTGTQFQEEPLQSGTKYKGWENIAILEWNRRLSWKQYEIGLRLLWNVNRNSYVLYRTVTFSMTLTNLNPVFKVTAFLKSKGQSYYRTLIGNHIQCIKWYHFQWSWLTLDRHFKVWYFQHWISQKR